MVNWQNGNTTSRETIDYRDRVGLAGRARSTPAPTTTGFTSGTAPSPPGPRSRPPPYGQTAPGIAHAWHMPGHTYTGLKRYADAAFQQEASARVDHAYMVRDRVMPFEIHNYAHNNQWLVTSLSHVGRVRDAVAVARNLVEQPRDPNKNGKNDGGSAQRNGRLRWSEVLARYELWDDLIAADESGALDWSDVPDERKQKAYTLGLAYAARNDQARLADQIAALQALSAEDAKAKRDSGTAAALAELEGYQLLARGEFGPAFERFAKATAMRPEALARATCGPQLRRSPRAPRRDAVAKNPSQVPPLAAQVEILNAVGKTEGRAEAYRKLVPLARRPTATARLPPARPGRRRLEGRDDWTEPAEPADRRRHRRPARPRDPRPARLVPLPGRAVRHGRHRRQPWGSPTTRGGTSSSSSTSAASVPTACSNSTSSARRSRRLKALNTDLVAVEHRRPGGHPALKQNKDGVTFPMPLLADPGLDALQALPRLRRLRGPAAPRHVPDRRRGNVRYQRVSSEPFLDTDFIKARGRAGQPAARPDPATGPRTHEPTLDRRRRPPRHRRARLHGSPLAGKPAGTLVVHEIYRSLQGESTFAGLPCVFVRLTACHLRCGYCDTRHAFHQGETLPLDEVVARALACGDRSSRSPAASPSCSPRFTR